MPSPNEELSDSPSLLALYVVQKIAKAAVYPAEALFVYSMRGDALSWAYGPEGAVFDPGPAGKKILQEVHHRRVDPTSPYIGRMKTHLLKVFPLSAESREFLGVLVPKTDQYDNPFLDKLLHSYILEVREDYNTDAEVEKDRIVEDCQGTVLQEQQKHREEQGALQMQVAEVRMQFEEEHIRFLEVESERQSEKLRLDAEIASVRHARDRLLEAAASTTGTTEVAENLQQELYKSRATLTATIGMLEEERGKLEASRESERQASTRLTLMEGDIATLSGELGHTQASLREKEELVEILKVSRDKFRATVDGFPAGVILHQKLHEISSLNTKMSTYIVQYDLPDAIGKKCYESIGLHMPCPGCPVELSFKSGEAREEEIFFSVKGTARHFRAIAMPVRNTEDVVEYVAEYFEDITDKVTFSQRLNELYMEGERMRKQIELQTPDSFHRLVENMVRAQRERKRMEVELLKSQSLLANLRRANEEMKGSMRKTTDFEMKVSRLLNIARNLTLSKMPAQEKFKTLQRYVLDYFE